MNPEYLVLTSGQPIGFRKFRVPAIPSIYTGHLRNGVTYTPNLDHVANRLPYRWQMAWERSRGLLWFDNRDNRLPAYIHLRDYHNRIITTLYFQPIESTFQKESEHV